MTLDETGKTGQDTTGKGSSAGKSGTTSEQEPKLIPENEVEKRVSDRLAAAGRDAKALENRGKELDAREEAMKAETARITKWQADRDREEEEAAKDSPEEVSLFQRKRALREKETKLVSDRAILDKEKAEHAAEIEVAKSLRRETLIQDIAKEHNLDPGNLKDIATELNLQTEVQIKQLAKRLGQEPPGDKTPAGLKLDTGKTKGGVGDLSGLSPRDRKAERERRLSQ